VRDDQQTRMVLAELQGEVRHRARWQPLTGAEMDAAVDAVLGIIGGRDDGPELLAYVAGVLTGAAYGWPELLPRAVVAGSVCVAAGADEFAVDGWCCVGFERAAGVWGSRWGGWGGVVATG
jgi:hypothetical protein